MLFANEPSSAIISDHGLIYAVTMAIVTAIGALWSKVGKCESKHQKCEDDGKAKDTAIRKLRTRDRKKGLQIEELQKELAVVRANMVSVRGEVATAKEKADVNSSRVDNISNQMGHHKVPTQEVHRPHPDSGESES